MDVLRVATGHILVTDKIMQCMTIRIYLPELGRFVPGSPPSNLMRIAERQKQGVSSVIKTHLAERYLHRVVSDAACNTSARRMYMHM